MSTQLTDTSQGLRTMKTEIQTICKGLAKFCREFTAFTGSLKNVKTYNNYTSLKRYQELTQVATFVGSPHKSTDFIKQTKQVPTDYSELKHFAKSSRTFLNLHNSQQVCKFHERWPQLAPATTPFVNFSAKYRQSLSDPVIHDDVSGPLKNLRSHEKTQNLNNVCRINGLFAKYTRSLRHLQH